MHDFANVDAFVLDFELGGGLTLLGVPESSRFRTDLWMVNTEKNIVTCIFYRMEPPMAPEQEDLDGHVFDLEVRYTGGVETSIGLDLETSYLSINGSRVNLEDIPNLEVQTAGISPDPDLMLGTLSVGDVEEAVIGNNIEVPVSIGGEGFFAVSAIQMQILFDDEKLVYNQVESKVTGVNFEVVKENDKLTLIWFGSERDFSEETVLAHLHFTYNSNEELPVDIAPAPATSIASNAGVLNPWETKSGTVTPADLPIKLTIGEVDLYSSPDVTIPLTFSGLTEVPDDIAAATINIKIAFDTAILDFAEVISDVPFNTPTVSGGVLTLTLLDLDGVTLEDGVFADLRFTFKKEGKSDIKFQFGTGGTSFGVATGGIIPISYVDGYASVAVSPLAYTELIRLRSVTTLELDNPDYNVLETVTTYPTTIKETELGFPVITNAWAVDGLMSSSEAIPAGSVITLTHAGGAEFTFVVEEEVAAGEFVFLSEMILQGNPDADVRTTLLSHKGLVETWTFDIRSPKTFETTLLVAVLTSHDDFMASEDGIHPGFVLAAEEIDMMVYGDPQLIFAFNGEEVATDFVYEICAGEEVIVSLAAILEGQAPFDITFTVNEEEFMIEGVELDDEIDLAELLEVEFLEDGDYAFVVTSIVDAVNRDVLNPEDIYYGTLTVHPLPIVLLDDFDGVCLDVEPFELTGGLPEGGVYSGDGVEEGVFSPEVAGAGTHTITYTFTSEFGCVASADATIIVFALPEVTCPADTTVMLSHAAFQLAGATPEGGVYSGPGVDANGMFDAGVAEVGEHTITYTYTDPETGCTAECSFKITVLLDTSVPGDPSAAGITLYPNPVRSVLTIEAGVTIKEIRMVDMLGQVVFSDNVEWTRYEMNVSEFRNGIYFVQILTDDGFSTHRVQVTR